MKFLRKRWRGILIAIVLLVIVTASGLIFWAGSEIASPTQRPLMDYHHEFLSNSTAHGLVIKSFTASDGTPCLVVTPDPSGNLGDRGNKIRQQLTARGLTLKPSGQIVGTLVLVHGRKGRKEDYLPIAERLCAAGFRCVIPDLPAHGDHPATIATYGVREATLPARVLTEAAKQFSFDLQPAGLLGMSTGGSVSVHAADQPAAPWKALAVICSFDSFPKVIEGQASYYIGSTLGPFWAKGTDLVYHWKSGIHLADIQPHHHAANLRIPTLIAHGTADHVSSITCGKCLFDSLPTATPKRWIEIPGAGHDNVLITAYPIYADIAEWMLRHVSQM
ncbi:MAG: alpha/beta fold hydrolase [Luteolibacter sp.]|uniref:alpha/beta hydrolase family protein n=1 Tax=Luteolibacter sp. TaxID=1962973 RepID=UPI00326533B8